MADTLLNIPGLNRRRRVFFVTETTYNTMVKMSATDAAKIRSGMINTHKPNRIDVEENRSSRSIENRYTANTPPTPWEFEFDVRPSGTAGTPADIHPVLKAAFGTYTNTPATSDAYTLSDTVQGLDSLSIHDFVEAGSNSDRHGHQLETLSGALVEELTISGNGTEAPKIRASGLGAQYALTGRSDINDAAPASQTDFDVTNGNKFAVNSIIAIYEEADGTTLVDDNSTAGHKVTAISSNNLTVADALSAGVADNDIVVPWAPSESVAGQPIDPSLGSLTFDGLAIYPIEWSFTLKNNLKLYEDQAFERYATGFHEGFREVTGSIKYRMKSGTLFEALSQRTDYGNITITVVMGSAAGYKATLVFKGEIDFDNFDRSVDETVIANVPLRGLASSANAKDELALTFS